jgi:hypothetical protein
MSEEEKKAVEKLEYVDRQYDCNNYYSRYELDCIEIVLNLIQKQSKIIDLMAELIARKVGTRIAICPNMKCDKPIGPIGQECRNCAKQFFENEVNEDE